MLQIISNLKRKVLCLNCYLFPHCTIPGYEKERLGTKIKGNNKKIAQPWKEFLLSEIKI